MYCVNCGVKLADTEEKCPLCQTVVYHPQLQQEKVEPLYPKGKMPPTNNVRRALSGFIIFLFALPLVISFFSDLHFDRTLDWFGFVAGGLLVSYITFFLPLWFQKPNPVIFVPCDFAAVILYLWYIDFAVEGGWFFTFALPVTAGLGLIVSAIVTLVHYVGRGKLYIFGGAFVALGFWLLALEAELVCTFPIEFIGWSVYPLLVFAFLGGMLIYLAIHPAAREVMERKLFF